MSTSPTVSVVIPLYNARSWIEDTLRSVSRQTYPRQDIELIVVDDASQDGGAELARAFIQEHGLNGRVITFERNRGVSAARNTGWQEATGAWIQFLDADDVLAPHKLELQATYALTQPDNVAVVYSSWQHLGLSDGHWQPTGDVLELSVDDDTVVRILQDFSFGYVWPTLIRKSFLATVGGLDERLNLGEDIDLMLRMAMAGGRFSRVQSHGPAFFYRQTPNSLWRHSAASVESTRNLIHVFRRAEEFLRQQSPAGLSADACDALARRYLRCVDFFVDHDPDSFNESVDWLRGLGVNNCPPGVGLKMGLMSKFLGYGNALRLRSSLRRGSRQLRAAIA